MPPPPGFIYSGFSYVYDPLIACWCMDDWLNCCCLDLVANKGVWNSIFLPPSTPPPLLSNGLSWLGSWIKQKRYNIKVGNTNLVNIVQRKKCKRYAWGEDIKGHVRTSSAVPPTVTIYLWINSDIIIIIIIKMHPYKAQPNWLQMSPISLFIPTSCPSAA